MRQQNQDKASIGHLQKYNSGRADRDETIEYLADTYRNSDNSPESKERFNTLHGKGAHTDQEAKEYRTLLWQAHDLSKAQYNRMGIDPTLTDQMQLQMLGPVRDAVNDKKNHQYDPTAVQIGLYTPEEAKTSSEFWSQRNQQNQKEKLEQQANHQPTDQQQTQPQNSGFEDFLQRWNNRPPSARNPEAHAAEGSQATQNPGYAGKTPLEAQAARDEADAKKAEYLAQHGGVDPNQGMNDFITRWANKPGPTTHPTSSKPEEGNVAQLPSTYDADQQRILDHQARIKQEEEKRQQEEEEKNNGPSAWKRLAGFLSRTYDDVTRTS